MPSHVAGVIPLVVLTMAVLALYLSVFVALCVVAIRSFRPGAHPALQGPI